MEDDLLQEPDDIDTTSIDIDIVEGKELGVVDLASVLADEGALLNEFDVSFFFIYCLCKFLNIDDFLLCYCCIVRCLFSFEFIENSKKIFFGICVTLRNM